jgi:hypothetical protein
MKLTHLLLGLSLFAGSPVFSQTAPDSTGLSGDHFDLYGALELFKSAASLEDFEKQINDANNQVNNLDLDENGEVDYINVIENMDGDAHAIQLQVAVNASESQDIAAIEIEKTGEETAQLQIVGDEELYGTDYIIEPTEEAKTGTTEAKFQMQGFAPPVVVVNVWGWRPIRPLFAPSYVVWVSPWRYRVYPGWYHPWRPVAWRAHHARVVRYHHPHYHVVHVHRCTRAHVVYHNHRRSSAVVHQRHAAVHQRQAANNRGGNAQRGGNGGKAQNGGAHKGGGKGTAAKGGHAKGGGAKGKGGGRR